MPAALGWSVLALVFLDELLLVGAVWVGGEAVGGWVLGVASATVVIALWAVMASPKAPYGGPVTRPVTKVLALGAACSALWWTDHHVATIALVAFSVVVNGMAVLPSVARLPRDAAR